MNILDRLLLCIVVLIPYQIYVPIHNGKNTTLYVLAVAAAVVWCFFADRNVRGKIGEIMKDRDQRPVVWYAAFWLCAVCAFFHSGNRIDAAKHVVYLGLGIALYILFSQRSADISASRVARVFLFSSIPLALLVLIIYVFKQHQYAILGTPLMRLFIEPDTLRCMLADKYFCNVIETGRAGGVFVNAQEGALFGGFNILLAGWLWEQERSKVFLGIAALWLLALVAFGTMTGIIACALTALTGLALMVMRRKRSFFASLALLMLICACVVAMPWLQPRLEKYRTLDMTVNGRTRIWHASLLVIRDHWLKGVGLDSANWDRAYAPYAEKVDAIRKVPPHNVFLFVWAKAGVIAFICIVGFFVTGIRRNASRFLYDGDRYALLVALVFVWFGIECLTENFLIMDVRIAGAFWMILAMRQR